MNTVMLSRENLWRKSFYLRKSRDKIKQQRMRCQKGYVPDFMVHGKEVYYERKISHCSEEAFDGKENF